MLARIGTSTGTGTGIGTDASVSVSVSAGVGVSIGAHANASNSLRLGLGLSLRLSSEGGSVHAIDAHHVIDVVRLHSTEKWFGSHSTLYDSRDIESAHKRTDSGGKKVMQKAHVHEVGHLLGLGHVDEGKAHCPKSGNTNASACYGISDSDMKSVMGAGMTLRKEHANPWRKAIVKLTMKGSATSANDWKAEMKRHYPRTLAEAAANQAITSRPNRK